MLGPSLRMKKMRITPWGPALEILSIAYAQMPLINALADISSKARCINFDLSLRLPPYFVYASSEGSDESAHMHRLA